MVSVELVAWPHAQETPDWEEKNFWVYPGMLAMLLFVALHLGQKPAPSVQKWSFYEVVIAFSGPWSPTRTAP